MSKLAWYWHRLRAMGPVEMALHARKKLRQFTDARFQPDWRTGEMNPSGPFPALPDPEKAPEGLRAALKRDVEEILAGRWKAFGHLELQVDDPPRWHKDYLVGRDLITSESAFKLNHRDLPDGADIKLIWELSRWHQLVRLAMAAYVLADDRAGRKCIDWLEDWVKHNPPYQGWNWTSALEAGMRLVQFTWIDALLSAAGARTALSAAAPLTERKRTRLSMLREQILVPHARFAWRHKSFGSSANNHLLGELVGLIVATVRWPELRHWAAPLEDLQRRWEHEVLAQFADDGGNKEQALNYQLFSWEFCWQAAAALHSASHPLSGAVAEGLYRAAHFFVKTQVDRDPWDYGDSDNAFVTPFYTSQATITQEWRQWLISRPHSPALDFWLGTTRQDFRRDWTEAIGHKSTSHPKRTKPESVPLPRNDPDIEWVMFQSSGQAVCRSGLWTLRWDLSPLGYLRTAAHGHLDALHLSIWYNGVAIVVDPGTGAYYADTRLRSWLASREAHNGPAPIDSRGPERLGPFLWAGHHRPPAVAEAGNEILGTVEWGHSRLIRRIKPAEDGFAWFVEDACETAQSEATAFSVRWQFAPGSWVKRISDRRFTVHRGDTFVTMEIDASWAAVELHEPISNEKCATDSALTESLDGIVSPAFRRVEWAPFLKLTARPEPGQPCIFRTTFLTSQHP